MVDYTQDSPASGGPSGQQREFVSVKYLDPALSPPQFVDVTLPTFSVNLLSPYGRRGRGPQRAPRGGTIGSYRVTGSWRELGAPGTYSLRITRMNIFSGSREELYGFWHSRLGTLHTVYFPQPGRFDAVGKWDQPLLVVPPGTLFYGFATATGSAYNRGANIEAIPG